MSVDYNAASTPIPRSVFCGETLPSAERFDAWHDSVLPLFETLPNATVPPEGFRARVDGFHLQRILISQTLLSAQYFRRQARYKADNGADPLLVQVYTEGGYKGHNGDRAIQVALGDICLLDLAHPLYICAEQSKHLTVVIPRDLISDYARLGQIGYGAVLRAGTPLAEILGHHLQTVWRNLPSASSAEIDCINDMLLSTIVSAFASRKSGSDSNIPIPGHVTLEAIRAHIDHNLAEPLGPDQLCRHFGCSRTQLYRLFQPLGGVGAYIRQARLNRCMQDLTCSDATQKRIIDIAFRWGFTSHSHFCRLFRNAFGMAPRDAVELWNTHSQRPCAAREAPATPAFYHWLRHL